MTYCVYEYGTGRIKQRGLSLDEALKWARAQLSGEKAIHAVVIMRDVERSK